MGGFYIVSVTYVSVRLKDFASKNKQSCKIKNINILQRKQTGTSNNHIYGYFLSVNTKRKQFSYH